MALLMLVLGVLSFELMNVDIFPAINLPVVLEVWNYPGLSALQIERRMVWISERAASTTVNGIEHIDSESMNGLGILKIYFYPGSDIGGAIAQITSVSESILSQLPRGTVPPQVISYDAANVPVAQLNIFSDTLTEPQLFDYGLNFIRIQLFTIPGFSSPAPLGGVQRAVMVNLDPTTLYANGLSPADVGNALAAANVVIPSGTAKMGDYEYDVDLNMSPNTVPDFNKLPIKVTNGTPIHVGDVAPVSDTHQPQTNVVRVDGQRGTYLMVIKHADASTLTVVDDVKQKIPQILASAPKGLQMSPHLRPVHLRPRRPGRGGPRIGHRRGISRADGARLHRLAPQHPYRHHVDTALDSHRDRPPQAHRPDPQHHDSRWPRTRGRDARR